LHRHAEAVTRVEAEAGEGLVHFAMSHDAGAAPGQVHERAFEDVDRPAGPAQVEAAEQPAHRTADDDGAARPRRLGGLQHDGSLLRKYAAGRRPWPFRVGVEVTTLPGLGPVIRPRWQPPRRRN